MWTRLLERLRQASPTAAQETLRPEVFLHRRRPEDVIIDVRTPAEYQQRHLEGALNLDLMAADFHAKIAQLDPSRTYYLYCRSGNRSGQATRLLRQHGLEAYNIGGLEDLVRAGAPLAP